MREVGLEYDRSKWLAMAAGLDRLVGKDIDCHDSQIMEAL